MSDPTDTRFPPGRSGNPAGRPPGARNRATLAREAALQERAQAFAERIALAAERAGQLTIERALAGSIPAARLLFQTLLARRALPVDLPAPDRLAAVQEAGTALIKAVLAGEISPADAVTLQRLLITQARLLKVTDAAGSSTPREPAGRVTGAPPKQPVQGTIQGNTGCPTPTRFLPVAEWLAVTGMGARLGPARRPPGGLAQAA